MVNERGRHTPRSYGSLYSSEDAMSIPLTTAGTYYVLTGYTAHISDGVTLNAGDGTITVEEGVYEVRLSLSFTTSKAGTVNISVYNDGAKVGQISLEKAIGTADVMEEVNMGNILDLAGSEVLDVRVTHTENSTDIDIDHIQFYVTRYY